MSSKKAETKIITLEIGRSPEYATLGQIEMWLLRQKWSMTFEGYDHKAYCKGDMKLRLPKHKLTNRESFDIAYDIVLQYERHSVTTRYGLGVLLTDLKGTYSDDVEFKLEAS